MEFAVKGQLISKANCQAMNSSKKQTNEFVFTTIRRVIVRFLEDIDNTKKNYRNYLTFSSGSEVCLTASFFFYWATSLYIFKREEPHNF
jgi:hypothetical protein